MGLERKDLIGSVQLKSVEIVGSDQAEKNGEEIMIVKLKDDDNQYSIGLFGADTINKVLEEHGREEDGKKILEVPESKLKKEGVGWINNPY